MVVHILPSNFRSNIPSFMRYVCLFITFEGKLLFVAPFCLHDASIARLTAPLGSSDQQASCRPAARARRTAPCLKFFARSVSVDMHLHTCVYDMFTFIIYTDSFDLCELYHMDQILHNYLFPSIPKTHPVDPVSRIAAL